MNIFENPIVKKQINNLEKKDKKYISDARAIITEKSVKTIDNIEKTENYIDHENNLINFYNLPQLSC